MVETISHQIFSLKSWPVIRLFISLFIIKVFGHSPANAAPSPDLWPRWQTHVADDTQVVDYMLQYAERGPADALKTYDNGLHHDYDWSLNEE